MGGGSVGAWLFCRVRMCPVLVCMSLCTSSVLGIGFVCDVDAYLSLGRKRRRLRI